VTGWYVASACGIAIWCALAVGTALTIARSVRLRDEPQEAVRASAPPRRPLPSHRQRGAYCAKGTQCPLHHDVICVVEPCCSGCLQTRGDLQVFRTPPE
jgi:hypothetical protein